MSTVPTWRFVSLNALGAAVWATAVGGAGYLFWQALELLFADLKKLEETLLVVILFGGLVIWSWRRWKFRRKIRR